jgi:site-specific DNA-adenine methylase
MNKSLKITFIIEAVILLVFGAVWFIYVFPKTNKNTDQNTAGVSEYDSRKRMGENVATKVIPPETGAVSEEVNYSQEQISTGKLIDSLPIETDSFRIIMDYANDKARIYLKPPYEINRQVFLNWIDTNGYTEINQEFFVLIENE